MAGPLDGIRVVDLSTVLSGPVATCILADQGADVIKVEGPTRLDLTRRVGSHRNGVTAMFQLANRGKRSVLIDLATAEGIAVLTRLVRDSDVFVQNFRPGVAERMGFGYHELGNVNPELVYVSIAGFGFEGPLANYRVYDNLIQAVSGLAAVQGGEDQPAYIRNLVCDKITALNAAQAITAALFARSRGAGGQHITLSMLDAAISFLWVDAGTPVALLADDATTIATNRSYSLTPHLDGWTTSAPVSDSEFRGWCRAVGAPEVADDPRFATQQLRLSSPDFGPMRRKLEERVASMTVAEAVGRFRAEGVDAVEAVPLHALADHPQVVANGTFIQRDHPEAGPIRETAPPARLEQTPAEAGGAAPAPGQHTDAILGEAGFDPTEIQALRSGGVIA